MNCPNGCSDCPNPICVCGENPTPQNELNLEACRKEKSIDLGLCIIQCNNDQNCENLCVDTFKNKYEECPCQVVFRTFLKIKLFFQDNCPLGCPCDSFDCEPDKKSILVLNTRSSNKPVLIKYDGKFKLQMYSRNWLLDGFESKCKSILITVLCSMRLPLKTRFISDFRW